MALVGRRSWRQRFVNFRSGWGFIVLLSVFVASWIGWNSYNWWWRFDAPPFVALNLLLSIEAAFAMPVLLMEQFKMAAEDRALVRKGLEYDIDISREVKAILLAIREMEEEERNGAGAV